MYDIIRDSPFGQIVRVLTKNAYFQYTEEREGFQHPYYNSDPFSKEAETDDPLTTSSSNTALEDAVTISSSRQEDAQDTATGPPIVSTHDDVENGPIDNPIERVVTMQSYREVQKLESRSIKPTKTSDGTILVDWYTTGTTRLGQL